MITKNILSITVIVVIAAIILSSSSIVNPLLAKSSKGVDKTASTKSTKKGTSATTTTSTTDQDNYKKFIQCLSTAAGTKGFATNLEIKNCYNPIYRPLSTTTTSSPTTFIPPSTSTTP